MVAYLKFRCWVPQGTDVAYAVYEEYSNDPRPLGVVAYADGYALYDVSDHVFMDAMPYEVKVALVGEPLFDTPQGLFPANRLTLYTGKRFVVFPLLSPLVPFEYTTGFGVYLGQVWEPEDPTGVSSNPPAPLYLLTDADGDGYDVWAVYTSPFDALKWADGAGIALLYWEDTTWVEEPDPTAMAVMYTDDGAVYTANRVQVWEDTSSLEVLRQVVEGVV